MGYGSNLDVGTLLGITDDEPLYLSPVNEVIAYRQRVWSALTGAVRWVGEHAIGAPPLALPATEALVGDDGRAVVRVDRTALDYIGVSPGEQVIVSWATRRTTARISLQTEGDPRKNGRSAKSTDLHANRNASQRP